MATVEFHKELLPEDPSNRPCTIIGKAEYIKKIGYGNVSKFLEPRVNEEVFVAYLGLCLFVTCFMFARRRGI